MNRCISPTTPRDLDRLGGVVGTNRNEGNEPMLIAKASNGKQSTLIVGLTKENVDRLAANQPIFKDLDDLTDAAFPGLSLIIMYGETIAELEEDLNIISKGQLK